MLWGGKTINPGLLCVISVEEVYMFVCLHWGRERERMCGGWEGQSDFLCRSELNIL